MAKCDICDRGIHFGNAVSHSNIKTKKQWKTNVKSIKVLVNGAPKKANICTSCLKSGYVERA